MVSIVFTNFHQFPGGHSERAPPDSFPNSEVKTLSADDSVDLPCESRSPPGFILKTAVAVKSDMGFLFSLRVF